MQEFLHFTGRQATGKMCHLHYPERKTIVISHDDLREEGREGGREVWQLPVHLKIQKKFDSVRNALSLPSPSFHLVKILASLSLTQY